MTDHETGPRDTRPACSETIGDHGPKRVTPPQSLSLTTDPNRVTPAQPIALMVGYYGRPRVQAHDTLSTHVAHDRRSRKTTNPDRVTPASPIALIIGDRGRPRTQTRSPRTRIARHLPGPIALMIGDVGRPRTYARDTLSSNPCHSPRTRTA